VITNLIIQLEDLLQTYASNSQIHLLTHQTT